MFDLYVLADRNRNEILNPTNELPTDWANVNGLNHFTEEKISDLSWAGHSNLGWFPISSEFIRSYTTSNNWIDSSKSNIKLLVATQRKERTTEDTTLTFNGNRLNLTDNTKTALALRVAALANLPDDTMTEWKFVDGYVSLSKTDMFALMSFVSGYIQGCFDVEQSADATIQACGSFEDIKNLSLTLNWPSKSN